ncbi:MAG: chromate transporter, partial [Albidovulum sp.]
ALSGVTAAVVGVIANLAIWFGLHVLFASVTLHSFGPLNLLLPDPRSLSLLALAIMLGAGVLLLRRHWSLIAVLALSAVAGALGMTLG